MTNPIVTYPRDPTGSNSTNLIIAEKQFFTANNKPDYFLLVPKFAPFFANNLSLSCGGVALISGVDYYPSLPLVGLSYSIGTPVFDAIAIVNVSLTGPVSITYQTIGGTDIFSDSQLLEIAANIAFNPKTNTWLQVVNAPSVFPPIAHKLDYSDLVTQSGINTKLGEINTAVKANPSSSFIAHSSSSVDTHMTTKQQIGLGLVPNFATASNLVAIGGISTDTLITPANLKAVINTRGTGAGIAIPAIVGNIFSFIVSTNTNVDVRTEAINNGWNQNDEIFCNLTGDATSTSQDIAALTINGSFPNSGTLLVTGAIIGKDGLPGAAGAAGLSGVNGLPGLGGLSSIGSSGSSGGNAGNGLNGGDGSSGGTGGLGLAILVPFKVDNQGIIVTGSGGIGGKGGAAGQPGNPGGGGGGAGSSDITLTLLGGNGGAGFGSGGPNSGSDGNQPGSGGIPGGGDGTGGPGSISSPTHYEYVINSENHTLSADTSCAAHVAILNDTGAGRFTYTKTSVSESSCGYHVFDTLASYDYDFASAIQRLLIVPPVAPTDTGGGGGGGNSGAAGGAGGPGGAGNQTSGGPGGLTASAGNVGINGITGTAGSAVVGNSNIVWINTGIRNGTIS